MDELKELFSSIDFSAIAKEILPILVVLLICMLVIKGLMRIIKKVIEKSKIEKSLHTFILNMIKIALYFMVVIIIADMLNIPITSLVAAFSVVGLAASLAIQDTLTNFASGIMILSTHPFKVGDYIEGAGTAGTVRDINFTHTILKTPDNKVIHVPNKQIVDSIITNFSEQSKRRLDLTFNLAYSADSKKIKEIMRNAVEAHPKVLKDEDIFVRATAYKESGIDYTLRVWVKSSEYWDIYFELFEGLKEEFDNNNIEIPYNQLDVHVHKI